jgi:hypothetical protein
MERTLFLEEGLAKLGVANRVQAAGIAHRLGITGEPTPRGDPSQVPS